LANNFLKWNKYFDFKFLVYYAITPWFPRYRAIWNFLRKYVFILSLCIQCILKLNHPLPKPPRDWRRPTKYFLLVHFFFNDLFHNPYFVYSKFIILLCLLYTLYIFKKPLTRLIPDLHDFLIDVCLWVLTLYYFQKARR
jgi:hypothetical protein